MILIFVLLFTKVEAKKMEYAVQLPAFIRAEHFGMHSEDDNEYVELYMHIAKLIEANHDWAVWHPREVNRMDKDDRSWITSENNHGREGWTQSYAPNGNIRFNKRRNLCGDGLTIDVMRFRVRVIKRVVAKLRAADYKVSYTLSNPGNGRPPSTMQNVELDDRPVSILITL